MLTDEQKQLREEARELVKWVPKQMIMDMDNNTIRFNDAFLREAGRRNLLGPHLPKEWGGRGMDWTSLCTALEEVGALGYAFGCLYGVGGCLVCYGIVEHGTDEQKAKYVKPLLAGDIFAAECLTEPRGGGGSDFFGTTTTAADKDDHFLVNGQKRFIVGAEGADYFLVYARTNFDPGVPPQQALTCLLIDRGPGVSVEYLYGLMGLRGCGTGRVVFKDVRVPKENVLGEVNQGQAVFETIMIPERLGSAMMCLGPASAALDVATGYTSRRKAFGKTINRFQGVSFQIADAVAKLDASRALTYMAAQAADKSENPRDAWRLLCEAKKFSTESCMTVVNNAMQVMGGIGYTNVFPIERIYRDIRLGPIWTGSNEVMSMVIAHEWYSEYFSRKALSQGRNYENDAPEADAADEKIYE